LDPFKFGPFCSIETQKLNFETVNTNDLIKNKGRLVYMFYINIKYRFGSVVIPRLTSFRDS
jgi:hypothetical protein